MKILVVGLIVVVMAMFMTTKMCDRVEDPKLLNEEDDIMQELCLLYSQKEDRLTKPVNTAKPESIDIIIARANQKAAELNQLNRQKKGTDEDSHQSRMGGRDYPRDYSR